MQINGLVAEVLFAWPARSPDLNPLDFHLWGHLKSIVHAARSIEHAEILRNRMEQGFRQIRETPGMIERATRSTLFQKVLCFISRRFHFVSLNDTRLVNCEFLCHLQEIKIHCAIFRQVNLSQNPLICHESRHEFV